MNYINRIVSKRLGALATHFPVVVVSGARQVGKSTLLKHQYPDWDLVVFDPVVDVGNARADPELFLRNHPAPLILDEIQYCPQLVPSLKRQVDENKGPGMYILTGSQQWMVLKSVSESLAGRAVFLDLEGFCLAEIADSPHPQSWLERYLAAPDDFVRHTHARLPSSTTLYERLWRGWLPEATQLPVELCDAYHAAYLRTYVECDVRLAMEVDDWQQFGRFVQLVSALTAQEINHSQLGRDVGVTPQTAKRWLSVLASTFQWYEIPAYHGSTIKRIASKPKGHFADNGFACHLNRISSPRALEGHPMIGSLFETAVAAELRKLMAPLASKAAIYHWRAHSGSEVDFLLDRDGILHPMEVKLSSRPSRQDTRGMRSLREHYPETRIAPGLVIAPVEQIEQLSEQEYAIPWDLA